MDISCNFCKEVIEQEVAVSWRAAGDNSSNSTVASCCVATWNQIAAAIILDFLYYMKVS